MKRRDFLKAASGGAGLSAVTGTASAATSPSGGDAPPYAADGNTTTGGNTTTTGGETTTSGGLPGAGTTKTVAVGPGNSFVFEPETVYVQPGATVEWVWESDFHNVYPTSTPEGVTWEGTEGGKNTTYDTGHTYSHQFTETGTYEYVCWPHRNQGMTGTVVVNESGQAPGGGGGGEAEMSPEEMGVPFQAHFVGIATILMVIVSLVFTFFTLKYGESRHSSAPNKQ